MAVSCQLSASLDDIEMDPDARLCPFCGADHQYLEVREVDDQIAGVSFGVCCVLCRCSGPRCDTVTQAILLWGKG